MRVLVVRKDPRELDDEGGDKFIELGIEELVLIDEDGEKADVKLVVAMGEPELELVTPDAMVLLVIGEIAEALGEKLETVS